MKWKKGTKVSHNGKNVIISHVFPDGSANIIDEKTHELLGKIEKPYTGLPSLEMLAGLPSLEMLKPELVEEQNSGLTVKDFNALMDANEEYFNIVEEYEKSKTTANEKELYQKMKEKEKELLELEKKIFK